MNVNLAIFGTKEMNIKKRFIAGAQCPECSETDTYVGGKKIRWNGLSVWLVITPSNA